MTSTHDDGIRDSSPERSAAADVLAAGFGIRPWTLAGLAAPASVRLVAPGGPSRRETAIPCA